MLSYGAMIPSRNLSCPIIRNWIVVRYGQSFDKQGWLWMNSWVFCDDANERMGLRG